MNLYINDISYQPRSVLANPHNLINDFVDVCERAKKYSFEKVVMPDDYKIKEIVKGFSFVSYQGTARHKDIILQKFKSILTNQIKKISADEFDDTVQYVYWNGNDSVFFKKALNQEVPVVSFRTQDIFDNHSFDVENKYLDATGIEKTTNKVVVNLSRQIHFTTHQAFLKSKLIKQAALDSKWNAKKNPLRFTDAINTYLEDYEYDKKTKNIDENLRRNSFFEAGTSIAEMNGWEHKSKINTKN